MPVLKNKRLFLILILLFALVFFLVKSKKEKGTIPGSQKDFALSDTSEIDKIFLADKAGHSLLLEKRSQEWVVNKKFPARKDVLQNLLYTLKNVEVKMPVANAAFNSIIAQLAASAIKVEIYKKGSLLKTYYVGGPTQDLLGTFMLMDKADRPFIMHIPGFNGYLTTRYSPVEEIWKERILFKGNEKDIASIKIDYPKNPEKSFLLDVNKKMAYTASNKKVNVSDSVLKAYLLFFNNTPFETWAIEQNKLQVDSILALPPLAIVEVAYTTERKISCKLYPMKDSNRLYAKVENTELLIVQHYVFDKILIGYEDLFHPAKNIYQQFK
jgi:hypothetical protein